MKLDFSKPMVLVNGAAPRRPARVIATDLKGAYPVAAAILQNDGRESVYIFNEDGKYSGMHLENVIEKMSKFQPLYDRSNVSAQGFKTLDDCINNHFKYFGSKYIGAIELKYEDGEFVGHEFHMLGEGK